MNADVEKAVGALRNYTQAYVDGVMVIASRQAIDEVLQALRDQEAEIEKLRSECILQRIEVTDEHVRAEKAEALLRETLRYLDPRHYSEIIKRITAHLGGEHEG